MPSFVCLLSPLHPSIDFFPLLAFGCYLAAVWILQALETLTTKRIRDIKFSLNNMIKRKIKLTVAASPDPTSLDDFRKVRANSGANARCCTPESVRPRIFHSCFLPCPSILTETVLFYFAFFNKHLIIKVLSINTLLRPFLYFSNPHYQLPSAAISCL